MAASIEKEALPEADGVVAAHPEHKTEKDVESTSTAGQHDDARTSITQDGTAAAPPVESDPPKKESRWKKKKAAAHEKSAAEEDEEGKVYPPASSIAGVMIGLYLSLFLVALVSVYLAFSPHYSRNSTNHQSLPPK